MLNFFIGFAFFEFGALCGFFVAALMQAARDGGEIAGRSRTENIQYCSVYYKADSPNDSECRKNCYSAVSGKDGWWQAERPNASAAKSGCFQRGNRQNQY
ncbi:hypothetical protein [Faecalibacterium sp. OM04-11BH]|jgi:hypothetical protein|uniref:hypothetical protein n=1 Tax=Faecalibacterium sp. OM04-11BH TaxID=2292357 RepID=UPI001FAB1FA9|nr:hypothetical protein [Faecalibacterium sp. OM04-11BH]